MNQNKEEILERPNIHDDPLLFHQAEKRPQFRPTEDLDQEFEDESDEEILDDYSEEDEKLPTQKIYDPLNLQPELNSKVILDTAKANLQLKNIQDTSFEYQDSSDDGEEYEFAEQPVKPEQPKESQASMFVSGSICIIISTLSILLWVILFADLTHRSNEISLIIEKTPTLKMYHQMYLDFFDEFLQSTTKYEATEKLLHMKDNQELIKYKRHIFDVLSLEIHLQTKIQGLEEAIQAKRFNESLLDDIKNLADSYIQLNDKLSIIKNEQVDFKGFYNTILKNVHILYVQAFELIDLYGRFYINTNRIWVSTENIYQLFERRAVDIQKEVKKKHFQPLKTRQQNVKLPYFEYQSGSIVTSLAPLNFNENTPLFLSCFIRAEVNNPELKFLDTYFSLGLGLNKHNPLLINSLFTYSVVDKFNRISFHQAMTLDPGHNVINLYAKINKGDLELNYVSVECLVFEEYADIPEYDKS